MNKEFTFKVYLQEFLEINFQKCDWQEDQYVDVDGSTWNIEELKTLAEVEYYGIAQSKR